MNSKINNSKQIYSASKKPCCKVCVDAGKPEKEYSSHYVKDLNGKVTCPTLLGQECRFCHMKGHTTSHCATLKKQKESEENSRRPPVSPPKKEVSASKKSNVFAYLEMNSDDSDDEVEQFPELVESEPKSAFEKEVSAPKKFSYASMASKTQAEYKIDQFKETKTMPFVEKKLAVKIYKVWPTLAPGQKKSWEQMCEEESSDEDEEEEEFDEENSAW
jgi:hypothetical protein